MPKGSDEIPSGAFLSPNICRLDWCTCTQCALTNCCAGLGCHSDAGFALNFLSALYVIMLYVVSYYFQLGLLQSFNEHTREFLFTTVLKNLERFLLLLMDPDMK